MRDTAKVEQTPLHFAFATMYSVYYPNPTRLTCRYHGYLSRTAGNFRKRAPHAGHELYLFVGDVPVSGKVSPQHVTPYVQCAGCRGGRGDSPGTP
jgi:hypothetical protein